MEMNEETFTLLDIYVVRVKHILVTPNVFEWEVATLLSQVTFCFVNDAWECTYYLIRREAQ